MRPADNNLSPSLAQPLRDAGHGTEHVRDHGLHAAPDTVVLQRARDHGQVLISADTDFGTLLARTGADKPSVILIRRSSARRATELATLLLEQPRRDHRGPQVRRCRRHHRH